jgi:hypothetical protein
VAYGARLESELGATPRGFKSRILRHADQLPVDLRLRNLSAHLASTTSNPGASAKRDVLPTLDQALRPDRRPSGRSGRLIR